jgi:hypothetical protein
MKYAFDTELSAMTYIPSLIETGSGIQHFMRQDSQDSQTQTACNPISLLPLLSYFQNKEIRLMMQLALLMAVKLKKVLCLMN